MPIYDVYLYRRVPQELVVEIETDTADEAWSIAKQQAANNEYDLDEWVTLDYDVVEVEDVRLNPYG